jgi:hypothetical protein
MDILSQTGHTKATSGTMLFAHSFTSALGEEVLILLHLQASTEDGKVLEKELKTIIQHSLLETEGDAPQRMDGTLKEINGLLKGLFLSNSIKDVQAIVALIEGNGSLHVSHAGRAEAYLIRGGAASQITEFTRGKPTPAFVHISSGDLHPRDAVVLSTQRLLRTLTPVQLAQLAQREDQLLSELKTDLESEKEQAALAVVRIEGGGKMNLETPAPESRSSRRRSASRRKSIPLKGISLSGAKSIIPFLQKTLTSLGSSRLTSTVKTEANKLRADLKNPKRKKRAHLLLLAGTLAVFLVVWAAAQLSTSSQRSHTKTELKELVEQINSEITMADTRRLAGDIDSANAILQRAESRAKEVMDNESGLFRVESLDLLDRIRSKSEEINNIVRLSPRVGVNLSAKNADILVQGFIGLEDGEFIVYDRQDLYRVLLNSVDTPDRLTDEELILDGTAFDRYQTTVFQTEDNSIIELISGQPTSMKTDDPSGWIIGKDIETYLRYLYVLSPDNNQIYKYERLSNRYTAPSEYNVNGDISGALDMAIDGNVYILKEGGEIVRLFRGEARPFTIRYAPDDVLANSTKLFKVADANFYFLDPVAARVVVATDGGSTGEASYSRQYILEGDQIGTLQDLYVDPDESQLYVLDDKRMYVIDLGTR